MASVTVLLGLKADPNVKDERGRTPLHSAFLLGNKPIARLLLQVKADPTIRDGWGCTPGHWAVKSGYHECLALLEPTLD